ncbi:hypothetical protein M3231_17455 [Neobacillus mesonae]|nr:hypothetical protein [Neobacillus mesonae]
MTVVLQVKDIKLEPHGWTAIVMDKTEEFAVKGQLKASKEEKKAELLAELKEDAYTLYRLLAGQSAELIGPVLRSLLSDVDVTCSCCEGECAHVQAALDMASAWAVQNPLKLLDMIGLSRDELLTGVFRNWSAASHGEVSSQTAALLERKNQRTGGNASAILEYIGDAATDGSLHAPGPGFKDVELNLKEPSELKTPSSGIAQLVPQVPAEAALEHIRKHVSARAAKWADEANRRTKTK